MSADPSAPSLLYRFPTDVRIDHAGVGSLEWEPGTGPFALDWTAEPSAMLASVYWQPAAFSAEECEAVIAMCGALPSMDGRAELAPDRYRVSRIAWVEPQPDRHWLYHKLGALFAQANRRFGFELTGFVDALQFTEYGSGEHFDWHMDIGRDQTSLRKLSVSIQLTDPSEYEGGMLEFLGLGAMAESRERGSATFFPSYMGHRVTPVTRGVRRSLVAWGSGAPFR